MTGMIGVIADHAARYTWFNQCLADLEKPAGTKVEWRMGANRGALREGLARACLKQGRPWIWFVDDDQVFATTVLTRLLSHDVDVVSALILQRGAPFLPTAYAAREGDAYQPLDLTSVRPPGLVKVAGVGCGGLLVRAEVLEDLDAEPFFVYSERRGEDLYFCDRLAAAGIDVYVDLDVTLGHLAPAAIMPAWKPGTGWVGRFVYADGTMMTVALDHRA